MKTSKVVDLSLFSMSIIAIMNFLVFWLTIATFPDFFFFNPLGNENTLRRFLLVFSTLGWVLISTVAPLLLLLYSTGHRNAGRFLPFCALLWPVSLLVSQISSYVESGNFYFGYLKSFPIFIFTDILLPTILVSVWVAINHQRRGFGKEAVTSITASGKYLTVL